MRGVGLAVALFAVNAMGGVNVPAPRVAQLPSERVLEKCDGHSARGCTQFQDSAMLCECRQGADGWRAEAAVRAVPSVYVDNLALLRHEMTHIADFRHLLKAHVGAIESRRFASLAQCESYTGGVMDAFGETLRRIARISADRRDGKAIATSEDHFVVVKAEIVPKLVNDRVADLANDFPLAARDPEYRTAENRDLVGQNRQHVEVALRQRNAPVDSEKLVAGGVVAQHFTVFFRRLFFDDDHDVVEKPRKLVRQLFESLFDELIELRRA